MKQIITSACLIWTLLFNTLAYAQSKQFKALFVGNSYTYTNDLPSLISQLAASTGDHLTYSSSTPGGYTFQQHASDATTLSLIAEGDWDYVVLQEQSQLPSFSDYDVATYVFPYAKQLVQDVRAANACSKPVFYMTWGKENGDQANCYGSGPLCTYEGVDDLLQERYLQMADSNQALVSPVAKVWRYLRSNYPSLELFSSDGSHPSLYGSYAAACAFYTIFYKKDPSRCTYLAGIPAMDATIIREAAKKVVYDSLSSWYQYFPNTKAEYSYTITANTLTFTNSSQNADQYRWDMGDGSTSTSDSVTHTYVTNGSYHVRLIASRCKDNDTLVQVVQLGITAVETPASAIELQLYPNPASDLLTIESPEQLEEIEITDLAGHTLMYLQPGSALAKLDVQELSSGIYVITGRAGEKRFYSRFSKK